MRTLPWLWLTIVACEDGMPSSVETPERQFVFEGVQIEERRGDEVLWSGTARTADGDMSAAWVDGLEVRYAGGSADVEELLVKSPRAFLELDAGVATFEQVVIEDEAGSTLEAGQATYEEEHAHILAEGPIAFSARGLTAHAAGAQVLMNEGTVNIHGPVEGAYVRPLE